jgi:hypothetical protein
MNEGLGELRVSQTLFYQKTFFLDNFITIRTQFDARLKS